MNEVFLNEALRQSWGDLDPFLQVDRMRGKVFRQVANRRTSRVKIGDAVFFLKRHHGAGWLEIAKNLLSLRRPVLGAGDEFRAARALLAAGVKVPEPVAYAERGDNPAARESFLLSRAFEPSISLEEVAHSWQRPGGRPAAGQVWRLLTAVADMTAQMHNNGVNHRDLYICHFLMLKESWPENPELALIDLHRAQVRAAVPRRWLVKDLGALWFSAADAGPSKRDAYRFIRRYTGNSLRDELLDPKRAEFWTQVGERASRLHAEAARKGLIVGEDPFGA